jgi:hypothetical protein
VKRKKWQAFKTLDNGLLIILPVPFISLFDFQNGLMRLFCRREFDIPYDFSLSLLQSR